MRLDAKNQKNASGGLLPEQGKMVRNLYLAVLAAIAISTNSLAAEFKMGLVMPMTGGGAETGKDNVASAKAAVSFINARGGIGGMKVEMSVCDSQSMEQQAVLCARRLVSDKANILVGAASTPQTLAIIPTAESFGVPLFSIAGGTNVYRPYKKWVFKAIQSNEDNLAIEVEFLKSKGWTRIAIIRDNGPFGTDISETFKRYAGPAGIQLVADESYSPADTDMTAQITRIRALQPQAIIAYSLTQPIGATVIKKIAQLGITVPIFVSSNLQSSAFIKLIGDVADQVIFVGQKAAMSSIPKDDPLYENVTAFREHFAMANPGMETTSISPNVVDLLMLIQAASRNLGERALDSNTLQAALETLKEVKGVQGIWSLSPTTHESSLTAGVAVMRYVKGNWLPPL